MENRKTYSVILGMRYDAEVVGKLETVKNKSGYIKELIRKDIAGELKCVIEFTDETERILIQYSNIIKERYKEQYDNNIEKTITFGCNKDKDIDIIDKLNSVRNISEYVKILILIDMGLIDENDERFVLINKSNVNNKMEISGKKRKSNRNVYKQNYAKEHYKQIPLSVSLDFFEELENHIAITGEPRNTFIKRAINEAIERDNKL